MMTQEQLKEKVRYLLNEPSDDADVTMLAVDTRKIDDYIEALLPEAVLFVQMNGRGCGVNPKSVNISEKEITAAGDGSGFLPLPVDFVSLITLQMDGWHRACNILYPMDSPMALAQSNRHTRGRCSKPVCVEECTSDGKRVIHCFSLPSNVTPNVNKFVYEARYIPNEGLSGNDEALLDAVAYQCAALIYNIFERRDNANSLLAIAAALCNSDKTDKKT